MLQDIWNTGDTHRRLPEPSPFRTPPAASGPDPASTESARGTPLPYDGRMQTLAIVCSESPNPRPAAFGALDAFAFDRSGDVGRYWPWVTEPCASWPATAPDRYAGPWDRRTANPVVVVGSTHDPATPHRNAVLPLWREALSGMTRCVQSFGSTRPRIRIPVALLAPSAASNRVLSRRRSPDPGDARAPRRRAVGDTGPAGGR